MSQSKQIRLCGFGGQGLVLAGLILGHAGVHDGKHVAGSDSYGVQARGGYALSDVIISDEPIVFPHVMAADILIPLSQEAYETYLDGVAADAVVLYDDQLVTPRSLEGVTPRSLEGVTPRPLEGVRHVGIPATAMAIKELEQKQAANIVMLGAVAAVTGAVSREGLRAAITEQVGERFQAVNLQAVEIGYRIGAEQWRLLDAPTGR
jgi:2-oxoglutarate ferredoxin oxidoreductase subunit gamma